MRSIVLQVTAVVVAATAALACGGRASIARYPGAPVVVISIDTLRADRLPAYGYARGSTPELDKLQRESLLFEDVYSHCPLTLPSHASLLTGLLPFRHGVRDNMGYDLPAGTATLAGRFKAAGYDTGAAVSAFVLRHQTGIAAGFDFFDDAIEMSGGGESLADSQRDGKLAVDSLSGWIDQRATDKVFAFLHLYEPHTPYSPPPNHRLPDPYDGEIAYADELVGRLLARVSARGWLDRAIVAIVSDHGEGLGDHGESEHGILLYREALHVPWLLRLPGRAGAGRRVSGTAGLVDVTATLLDLAGLDATGMDGRSVRSTLESEGNLDRDVYAESLYARLHLGWSDLRSIASKTVQYIQAPKPELYDFAADPAEQHNLADSRGATVSALDKRLEEMTARSTPVEPGVIPEGVRKRLESLGYLGSAGVARPAAGPLPDPKDRIAAFESFKRALALERSGRTADAIDQYRRVLASDPRMLDAWESLARALAATGRTRDAIDALGKAIAVDPMRPDPHLALARIYALERQPALARQHAEIGSERDPAQGFEILAELMMDANKPDDAAAFARRSLLSDPSRYMSEYLLGVVAQQKGRCGEATPHFERAIQEMRLEPHAVVKNLHAGLADCLARSGRDADAEREFKAELAAIPDSPEASVGLATLYKSQGHDEAARRVLTDLVANTRNPDAETYWTVVRGLRVLGDAAGAREWAARASQRFPRDARFR